MNKTILDLGLGPIQNNSDLPQDLPVPLRKPRLQIGEKISRRILSGDQGMVVWWSIGAGVHVEPHSHANEQIVWMLKGKMEFRLGSEQRVCGPGDVVVIPGGTEHEAWFHEDRDRRGARRGALGHVSGRVKR